MPKGVRGAERTRRVSARLNKTEWEAWRDAATFHGYKELGTWIRRSINTKLSRELAGDRPSRQPLLPSDRIAYRHLVAIGNNLNQLARLANIDGDLPEGVNIAEVTKRIRGVLDQLADHMDCVSCTPEEPATE